MNSDPSVSNGIGDEPLRFVFLGESIVSDVGNPGAFTSRAVLHELQVMGHETRFLEPRLNDPTRALLERAGADGLSAFREAYPELLYVTYDIPSREQVNIWLGREATTSDAIVALRGTPQSISSALHDLDAPFLTRLWEVEHQHPDSHERTWLRGEQDETVSWRPSLMEKSGGNSDDDRHPLLVVACDNVTESVRIIGQIAGADVIATGSAPGGGMNYVAGPRLPETYRHYRSVAVLQGEIEYLLLPLAQGCQVFSLSGGIPDSLRPWVRESEIDDLAALVGETHKREDGDFDSSVWAEHSARTTAEQLVLTVRNRLQAMQPR